MRTSRSASGFSSCLLGAPVRFDGGHKRDTFLTESFGRFVNWVPVCPEVECGLGAPRETMRLVSVTGRVRLLTTRTGVDLTDRMDTFAERRVPLIVPLTLLRHYVRMHKVAYLAGQGYLEPHPRELMLLNHV